MTDKELNVVRELRDEICILERRLQELRMSAENLVPIIDGLPHATEAKSRVEKIALMIVADERELENLREQFMKLKSELANKIMSQVSDPILQTLLVLRYVECLSFKETARRMKSSLRHVYRLHEKIFKHVTILHSCGTQKS